MTLPSRHRIQNSCPGGLRPSTLPLGHGGSTQYQIFASERERNIYFRWNLKARLRFESAISWLSKQAGSSHCTRAPAFSIDARWAYTFFFRGHHYPGTGRTISVYISYKYVKWSPRGLTDLNNVVHETKMWHTCTTEPGGGGCNKSAAGSWQYAPLHHTYYSPVHCQWWM